MNFFPNSEEEINLIKFVAKFQYLNANNTQYFFSSKKYYRNRIKNLISKKFLKKQGTYFILDVYGIEYVKIFNIEYNPINRNIKYLPRLFYLSDVAAFYNNIQNVKFFPSFERKGKDVYTLTARRYIGTFVISGFEYLAYHISKNHSNKYIMSVIYDIQKEKEYKNILIFTDDISKIDVQNFVFGMNKVLIIEDTKENREKLINTHNIDISKIIQEKFKSKIYLAEYIFCEYTDYLNKFVAFFYFLDTEKINRIKYFLLENRGKNVTIICDKSLEESLKKCLPNCIYIIIDYKNYLKKEQIFYD